MLKVELYLKYIAGLYVATCIGKINTVLYYSAVLLSYCLPL